MSLPVELTHQNFDSEVLDADLPVLVDFWAQWCGPCRMMAPVLEEFATKAAGKMKVAKLNVDEGQNQVIAEKYDIQGIPALKVFQKGQIVKELVGYQPIESLESELKQFLA